MDNFKSGYLRALSDVEAELIGLQEHHQSVTYGAVSSILHDLREYQINDE
jgi:hypothetical protein